MSEVQVIIVGGGPAGLSCAAALKKRGIEATIFDKNRQIGDSWAQRYKHVKLHTVRRYSGLAHYPIPKNYPQYVPKDMYVQYLQDYAAYFDLDYKPDTRVQKVRKSSKNGRFLVELEGEEWHSQAVVIATGHHGKPVLPDWPGRDEYRGQLMHSGDYYESNPFVNRRVLVVGSGNSGCEIATELAENGAFYVAISIRTSPAVVPRDFMGTPSQVFGILLSSVPPQVADRIGMTLSRIALGDLTCYGLQPAAWQPFSARRVPVIDVGFVRALKKGLIQIRPNVSRLTRSGVIYENHEEEAFDMIIMATGFRTGLGQLLDIEDLLRADEFPAYPSGDVTSTPGLYFMGYTESHRGHLYEANQDARRLSKIISTYLEGS